MLSLESQVKIHALLCSIGFLIVLPIGALTVRYVRNVTNNWWHIHLTIQLLIAGPIIFTGWYYGHNLPTRFNTGHYTDPHKKIGLTLLVLFVFQVALGLFIHYIKTPKLFNGHRPPQNYFHATLGLLILALAAYQVHYGFTIEDPFAVSDSYKTAWLALIITFWSLYAVGLVFLPRQYRKEKEGRQARLALSKERTSF